MVVVELDLLVIQVREDVLIVVRIIDIDVVLIFCCFLLEVLCYLAISNDDR